MSSQDPSASAPPTQAPTDLSDKTIYSVDVAIPAFNASRHIAATLDAVLAQRLPGGTRLRIFVADDASSDDLQQILRERYRDSVVIATHATNRGRSAACNTAIGLGNGNIIIVLDADCRFADDLMIARMLEHFDAGAEAVIGTVDADAEGFWGRYAGVVSRRRVAGASQVGPWHMTTANFAIRRLNMNAVGGFSTSYHRYGFEDRDLLIRLHRAGTRMVVDERIVVLHRAPESANEVCWKLYQSGRYTAREFSTRFPEIYSHSLYRRFDLSTHPRMARFVEPLLRAGYRVSCLFSEALVRSTWMPFPLQTASIRASSALAYMLGTCHAAQDQARSGSTHT